MCVSGVKQCIAGNKPLTHNARLGSVAPGSSFYGLGTGEHGANLGRLSGLWLSDKRAFAQGRAVSALRIGRARCGLGAAARGRIALTMRALPELRRPPALGPPIRMAHRWKASARQSRAAGSRRPCRRQQAGAHSASSSAAPANAPLFAATASLAGWAAARSALTQRQARRMPQRKGFFKDGIARPIAVGEDQTRCLRKMRRRQMLFFQ